MKTLHANMGHVEFNETCRMIITFSEVQRYHCVFAKTNSTVRAQLLCIWAASLQLWADWSTRRFYWVPSALGTRTPCLHCISKESGQFKMLLGIKKSPKSSFSNRFQEVKSVKLTSLPFMVV